MATAKTQIYKCAICGNIVEVVHASVGALVCCNQPMELLNENTTDAATEKHVPVITPVDGGVRVAIGEVPHPMTDEHYIEFIEAITEDGKVYRQDLAPGMAPETVFPITGTITAREYCNKHGLWKA